MKNRIYTIAVWGTLAICALFGFDAGTAQAAVHHHLGLMSSMAIGGLTVNAQSLDAATRAFKTIFNNAFGLIKPQWETIAMRVTSTTAANDYEWLGQLNGLREWLGDKVLNNLAVHGYYLKNKDFEQTVSVDRNAIADDQIGVYEPLFKDMGDAAARHPDQLMWQAIVNGLTTGLCFDGLPFFSTAHPIDGIDAGNGTYANRPASLGTGDCWFLMDSSRPIKPMIFQVREDYHFVSAANPSDPNVFMQKKFLYSCEARVVPGYGLPQLIYGSRDTLSTTNYEAARLAMTSLTRPDGSPLGMNPDTLVVGENHFKEANELVKNERDSAGATNPWFGSAKVVRTDYLNGI